MNDMQDEAGVDEESGSFFSRLTGERYAIAALVVLLAVVSAMMARTAGDRDDAEALAEGRAVEIADLDTEVAGLNSKVADLGEEIVELSDGNDALVDSLQQTESNLSSARVDRDRAEDRAEACEGLPADVYALMAWVVDYMDWVDLSKTNIYAAVSQGDSLLAQQGRVLDDLTASLAGCDGSGISVGV